MSEYELSSPDQREARRQYSVSWGYEERTEAGRHCYVYHHALDYLLDRLAAITFRLACAMTESLHAWEAGMREMHRDVMVANEVTLTRTPAPVDDGVTRATRCQ